MVLSGFLLFFDLCKIMVRKQLRILGGSLMFQLFALCFSLLLFDIFTAVVVLDHLCTGKTPKTWCGWLAGGPIGTSAIGCSTYYRDFPIWGLSQKPKKFLYSPGNGCTDTQAGRCPGSLCQNWCVPRLSKLPFTPPPNPPALFSLPAALIICSLPVLRNSCLHINL